MALATIAQFYASKGLLMPDPLPEATEVAVTALLEDASDAVRGYLFTGVYPHDADGNATEQAHIDAIVKATCKQARYFELNPRARDELQRSYDSIRAGSFSLTTSARSSSGTSSSGVVDWRSPAAIRVLMTAGLTRARTSTSRY